MDKNASLWNKLNASANSLNAVIYRSKHLISRILHGLVICAMLTSMMPVGMGQAARLPDGAQDFQQTGDEPATPSPTNGVDITGSITATLTLTATLSVSPTITLTPSSTAIPTQVAETPTPTETPPAETPDPYPQPTTSPTPITVSPTPTPEPIEISNPGESITITLHTVGDVLPGTTVRMQWVVNALQGKGDNLTLVFNLPVGFTPPAILLSEFDPATRTLTLAYSSAPHTIEWEVAEDAQGPFSLTVSLFDGSKELAQASAFFQEEGLNLVGASGGRAVGLGGRVQVIFPANSTKEDLEVRVRSLNPKRRTPTTSSGEPFEIVANARNTRKEVHQFTAPLIIEVPYSGRSDASIFYYDETTADWRALPTEYDREAGVLRATSSHLSVFDTSVNEWEAARVPTVDGALAGSQSGAASYSYPIWTPPGPAGLQPSLAISYNSQVIDGSSLKTQADWVGMGWSLDTGYIVRNTNGTLDGEGDDTFSIVSNGISGRLLKGTDGYYHTENEFFWRIQYDEGTDIWTVWDKEGNKYTYGGSTNSRAIYPNFHQSRCDTGGPFPFSSNAWKWMLSEVQDKFGQTIIYTYTKDTLQKDSLCDNDSTDYATDISIYPATIVYPNDRYYISFTLETALRTDYDSEWDDPDFRASLSTASGWTILKFAMIRLAEVEMMRLPFANTTLFMAIRFSPNIPGAREVNHFR